MIPVLLLFLFFGQAPKGGPPSGSGEQLTLNWFAPAHSVDPVVGYNLYRADVRLNPAKFLKVNSKPITKTSYPDLTIVDGGYYLYYVVSVDANGVESVPSNSLPEMLPYLQYQNPKPNPKPKHHKH